jgi:hypothetical protein
MTRKLVTLTTMSLPGLLSKTSPTVGSVLCAEPAKTFSNLPDAPLAEKQKNLHLYGDAGFITSISV